MRVIIVGDESGLAAAARRSIAQEGFEVHMAMDPDTGLDLARTLPADLVITDLTLPGVDGIEMCRRLRAFSDAYVIMLAGQDSEVDRLVGLSAGADDYVAKPFSDRELVARIRAMQRRPRCTPVANHDAVLRTFGALAIDTDAHEVRLAGAAVGVSCTEYDILDALSARPNLSLRRSDLLEQVWGTSWFGDEHVVDVHVSNVRRKLGDDPRDARYIKTVRGFGYRMGQG